MQEVKYTLPETPPTNRSEKNRVIWMQTIPFLPFVSIIIPIRNEARYIERCLEAVYAQDYASDRMEVLVIDGMSTDGTRESFMQIMAGHTKFPIYRLDNPAHIVPTALNIGLSKAKGDIIVRVDGHCEIAPDFISCCVKHLQEGEIDGVGGSVETIGETRLSQSIAIAMSSFFGVGGSTFRTLKGKQLYTNSIPFPAYKQETIRLVGLYDEELYCNEDDEYNYRLRKLGMKLLLASDIRSRYYCRGSFNSLWRQYYRYGYWKVRVLQKHPRQMRPRHFVPPLFVGALFISLLLAVFIPLGRWAFVLITGVYLLANLTVSVWATSKRSWRHLPLLPVVFSILHISYGLGFLCGLVRFAHRWGDKVGKVPAYSPFASESG